MNTESLKQHNNEIQAFGKRTAQSLNELNAEMSKGRDALIREHGEEQYHVMRHLQKSMLAVIATLDTHQSVLESSIALAK